MGKKARTILVWVGLVLACALLFQLTEDEPAAYVDYSVFLSHVEAGDVAEVRIVDGNAISVSLWSGVRLRTLGLVDDALTQRLSEQGAVVAWGEAPKPLRRALMLIVPLALFLLLLIYFLRKASGGTANAMALRKSRARVLSEKSDVSFDDIGGCEEAKQQLGDVIDFLRNPDRWRVVGVRLPRGVLLEGPPGCGKTLLARAVAGETDAKFFYVSASEFVEMFVGVGAARVRDMFETAAKQAPAVIFIDELDAIGRRRGSGVGLVNDEREHTLNQLLVSLDGFETDDRVAVIAATNRADILDAALLRSGRFDRRIAVPLLSEADRERVLAIHSRNKPLAADVSLAHVAQRTAGSTGADLEALVNEAGLLAVRRARRNGGAAAEIRRDDFARALDPAVDAGRRFDQVDALLIESTTRLTQPTGRAIVRLTLHEGAIVEGQLIWADAAFVKVQTAETGGPTIVPKHQIKTLEPLGGTDVSHPDDLGLEALAREQGSLR